MKKFNKTFHYCGESLFDPCPGRSELRSTFIARNESGRFFVYEKGDNDEVEIGTAQDAAKWIWEESGFEDFDPVTTAIQGIKGFEELARILEDG